MTDFNTPPKGISKKCGLHSAFFVLVWYIENMVYYDVIIDAFWAIMQQMTVILVPLIAIVLIFKLLKGLFYGR